MPRTSSASRRADGPVELTLVTLGPMTNLAVALERDPELPRLLRRLVFMGGAFRVPGNTTPTTEWNIHCDPEAAQQVFEAFADAPRRPLGLGLDVTEQARIVPDHVVELARRAGSRPDDSIALAHGEHPLETHAERGREPDRSVHRRRAPLLHGVPPSLRRVLRGVHPRPAGPRGGARPGLVTAQPVHVDVDTAGGLADGQTIADWRGLTGKPANVDVAVTADVPEFLRRFVERVGGLAERRSDVAL